MASKSVVLFLVFLPPEEDSLFYFNFFGQRRELCRSEGSK